MNEIYTRADPHYTGRVTVPVLWDRREETIVSNESPEIIRMLNTAFDEWGDASRDFYPKPLRAEIDAINERVYATVNNGVYRAGFAKSRDAARQAIRHNHILVNGKRVNIPSFLVSEKDIIEVRGKSAELTPFVVARAEAEAHQVPGWIEVVSDKMRILVHTLPVRQQIDTQVQEQLIVELYSK